MATPLPSPIPPIPLLAPVGVLLVADSEQVRSFSSSFRSKFPTIAAVLKSHPEEVPKNLIPAFQREMKSLTTGSRPHAQVIICAGDLTTSRRMSFVAIFSSEVDLPSRKVSVLLKDGSLSARCSRPGVLVSNPA